LGAGRDALATPLEAGRAKSAGATRTPPALSLTPAALLLTVVGAAQLLEKLLKSKDPNDLMKANKLIKKMVDQVHARSMMARPSSCSFGVWRSVCMPG
jgi:hypothetical protein